MKKPVSLVAASLMLSACAPQAYTKEEIEAAFAQRDQAIEVLADAILRCCDKELPDPK
jgi:hypothetical protein